MTLRWVIAGGGTGGHVTPALALAEEIRRAGDPVRLVGTRRGLETRLVPEAGFDLAVLDSRPLVGRGVLERLRNLVALGRATGEARRLLRAFRADVVVAVGGYASVPPALAAFLLRIPVALVNTDAVPGHANRLLARRARRIFTGFPGAADALRRGPDDDRVETTGVPLRAALRRALAEVGDAAPGDGPLRLFVFGGSQGARQINETLVAALAKLDPSALRIVHQSGEADRVRVAEAYRRGGFEAEVIAFERDMAARYRWAELVLCRAGAISVAELALAGRAALLVPLAHVGGGEQVANARELERVGAARILDARTLRPEDLVAALQELAADRAALAEMGRRARTLAHPEAAARIVAACRELAKGGRS